MRQGDGEERTDRRTYRKAVIGRGVSSDADIPTAQCLHLHYLPPGD